MKIALISPRGSVSNDKNFSQFWENAKEIAPYREEFTGFSSGLLVLASLIPASWEIYLFDENLEDINFNSDYDLIGISTMTQQATRAYEIAEKFRRRKVKVILGGIHPTVLPQEAKEHADSVIIGEVENIWNDCIDDFLKNNLRPYYHSSLPVDLTKNSMPRYDLLKNKKYKVMWVQTSRGCPIDCEFCCASKTYGLKIRYKAIKQVIEEIKFILDLYGNHILISFADDNMFINRKYSKELVKELVPLRIRWFVQSDISIGEDEDFLKLLKESGCSMVFIGFETVDENNLVFLDKFNYKSKYINKYSKIIEKIQSYGIGVMGAFIIGFDNDDNSIIDRLSNFIIETNMYAAQISILTPLPGTRLRERLEKNGRLLETNWGNYTFGDVNFIPKNMTTQILQDSLLEIYRRIYSPEVRLKKAQYFKKIYLNLQQKGHL